MAAGTAITGELGVNQSAWLDTIVQDTQNRHAGYKRLDDYYDGKHNILLTARAKKYLEASGQKYAHNFCERVVDCVTDKLVVNGVTVKVTFADTPTIDAPAELQAATSATPVQAGTATADAAERASKILTAWLEAHLDTIGFDEISGVVHHHAACKGDGYAQAYWDEENQRPEISCESPEACAPFYCKGKPHQMEYVAKTWEEDQAEPGAPVALPLQRLNLYYPDRIEKYVKTLGGQWLRWWDVDDGLVDDEDADSGVRWPVPWVRAAAAGAEPEPRGLSIAHFRNKNRGKRYGKSELHTALPQQDAINKRMIDLDLVNDNQGYAQRWATGIGTSSRLSSHPGVLWRAPQAEAKFGQFPAGDPTGIIATLEAAVQHLSGTTATPLHELLITGTPPSGESIKTAEGPFVTKVQKRSTSFGRQWADLFHQLIAIAIDHEQIDGIDGLESARITIQVHWISAETRNEKEHWEVQSLKQAAGVSVATTLEEDGYQPDQERERKSIETNAATAAIASALNRGDEFGGTPA